MTIDEACIRLSRMHAPGSLPIPYLWGLPEEAVYRIAKITARVLDDESAGSE